MRSAGLRGLLSVVALVLLSPSPVWAHKLNVFASAKGRTIEGKAYFRGGTPAQGVAVTALGPAGEEIGKTKTDEQGRFAIEAQFRCDHRILVDTGDGHGGEYLLPGSALPKSLPDKEGQPKAVPATGSMAVSPERQATSSVSSDQLDSLRAEIVRLEEQLNAYEDRIRMTDIVGGIGYIVGITGAAYYYVGSRRK
jgi:nickel transport protein